MTEYLLRNNKKLNCTKANINLKRGGGRTITSNDASQPVEVVLCDGMLYLHTESLSDDAVVRNNLDSRIATYAYPLDNIAEFEFVLAKDFDKDLLLLRRTKAHEAEQASKEETDTPDVLKEETDTPNVLKEETDTPDRPAEPIQQELAAPLRWWRKLTGRA